MAGRLDKHLKEYCGSLDAAAVAEGMNAANRNACRLTADARILLDAERYPTAAAVAALAIEEAGKASIMRGIAVTTEPEKLRTEWRRYRDHRSKNGAWILPDLVAKGASQLTQLQAVVERDSEHTALLNSVKQVSLYTDCYGSAHWSEPIEIVNPELASTLVGIAELLCKEKRVSTREIELWIEHLGPAWNTSEMPHALLRWAAAMHREGLTDATPEGVARLVFGEAGPDGWKSEAPKQH